MKVRISYGVVCTSRDVGMPASRASTSWVAAQIRISASHTVAMPCWAEPSTRTVTPPERKSIGTVRFDFASGRIARYVKLEIMGDSGGLWWRIDELRVLQ